MLFRTLAVHITLGVTMADTRPTPAGPWRAFKLCAKAILAPAQMAAEDQRDEEIRKTMGPAGAKRHPAYVVRRAFFSSFALVAVSASVGYSGGYLMGYLGRCATAATVSWLQIVGASVLLWGTLFIRGWELQTHGGVTPTERVNQWIYRALYCIGTAALVYSLAFPPCKQ